MKKEYFVSFFIPKANIALVTNKITFKITTKKKDKKSKFGVQGPDLYSADELKIVIAIDEIV